MRIPKINIRCICGESTVCFGASLGKKEGNPHNCQFFDHYSVKHFFVKMYVNFLFACNTVMFNCGGTKLRYAFRSQ